MYLNKLKIILSMIAAISIFTMTGCADGAPANTVSTEPEAATTADKSSESDAPGLADNDSEDATGNTVTGNTVTGNTAASDISTGETAAARTDSFGAEPPMDSSGTEPPVDASVDYSSEFSGLNGCAVIYSPQEQTYEYYNQSMCETELSPYSTFKLISALLGLEYGVIQDESSTMDYDGTQYPVADWNRNVTLKEAFGSSCIWYFHQVLDAVGQEKVENALASLNYGNGDVSQWEGSGVNPLPDLNGFWQASSLQISPVEQVRVIADIFEGSSMFADKNVEILKSIMLVDTNDAGAIYGKTGSGVDGQAWFVGFSEKDGLRRYIAVCLNDAPHKAEISGNTAREIALRILKS